MPSGRTRCRGSPWWATAVVLIALACLVGAGLAGAAAGARIVVGPGANGTQRVLRVGDALVVRLPSNPSTGYSWSIRSSASPVLARAGRAYVPPDGELVGAPGTARLRFRAVAVGRGTLRLAYVRPWEHDAAPARAFALRVVVRR